jgi:hypothetical protein
VRTIIAGSRHINDAGILEHAMAWCGWTPTVVLSGACRGVDALGERWAAARGIPVERYPAGWDSQGRQAGPARNALMVSKADALVAIPDAGSRGTIDVIRKAKAAGLRVFVHGGEDQIRHRLATHSATRLLPDADFPAKDGGNHRSTSAMNTAESLPDEGNSGVVSRGGGSGMGPDGTRR